MKNKRPVTLIIEYIPDRHAIVPLQIFYSFIQNWCPNFEFPKKMAVTSNCLNDLPCCWSSIGITLRIASKSIQTFVQK